MCRTGLNADSLKVAPPHSLTSTEVTKSSVTHLIGDRCGVDLSTPTLSTRSTSDCKSLLYSPAAPPEWEAVNRFFNRWKARCAKTHTNRTTNSAISCRRTFKSTKGLAADAIFKIGCGVREIIKKEAHGAFVPAAAAHQTSEPQRIFESTG